MAESYRRWRLPQLWEMVAADDAADAHLHLATLRRQQTALETQRDRLRALRDQLAEGWPPDRSDAATAFLQRVNDMIDAMTQTAFGAAELRTNVSHVVSAIAEARADLAPLVAKYGSAEAHPDRRIGRQAQKSLDDLARQIVMRADNVVAEAAPGLAVNLPHYAAIRDRVELEAAGPGQVPGGGPRAGGGGGVTSHDLIGFVPPTFNPPAPVERVDADDDFRLAVGGSIEPSLNSVGIGYPEPRATGAFGLRDVPVISNGVIGGPAGITAQTDTRASTVRGPVMGVPPTRTSAIPRTDSGGSQPGRRLPGIPAGGSVIRPAGNAAGAAGGYRDRSFEEYVARRRTPVQDHEAQWAVPEGVTPLIEASTERPHDVGPGVLGIDR